MNENEEMSFEEEGASEKAKAWIQENLRVVVSVFIVAAIALGIYSYSDRSVPTDEAMVAEEMVSSEATEAEDVIVATEEMEAAESETKSDTMVPAETSRETESTFVETATGGEGLTHLARKAAAHYLEKNTDSALTAEHKIYIEDYLRKKVGHEGGVSIGTSVEFSKDLIRDAIAQSKTLNERQLKNLEQYSARVSEFRK
ncbi:MAG: hypothetical protein KBD19_03755 [Candidatus Moranbacteria bacterium]|nr:hypothetical protein [Candidatus Moranbacteria bacterium]